MADLGGDPFPRCGKMWPPLKATFQDVSLAGHPGGDGGRPWRGPRATLAGTGILVLAKRAWRVTLAGTADDPGGAQLWHSKMWPPLKTTWQDVAPLKTKWQDVE